MPPTPTGRADFKAAVLKTVRFLEAENLGYLILGGVAVGVIGEPRFTADLDINLSLARGELPGLLGKLQESGFSIDPEKAAEQVARFGTFKFLSEGVRVDIILMSTALEREALKRRQHLSLFGRKMSFPSPEDLILLKLIPGRHKDLADAESIALRHRGKLDGDYLKGWAQRICDEAQDHRVLRELGKLLGP